MAALCLVAALLGAATSGALGQSRWGPPFIDGMLDSAKIEESADRAVRHIAIEINATAEQQDKLRAIVKATVKDLVPLRDKGLTARDRGRLLLTQPSVDGAALEQLRLEQLAIADAASKRITQALGDVAGVLTLEQRRAIDQRMTELRALPMPPMLWHRG
jgi:Spy/CpxP family protein refolding chaperone